MRKFWPALLGLILLGDGVAAILLMSPHWKGYCLLLGLQLLFLLPPFLLGTFCLSAVGSGLRWIGGQCGWWPRQQWRLITAEALVVGLMGAGAWLVWSPRDVYFSPTGSERITFREPSALEAPFGLADGSDVFIPVMVTYTDVNGRSISRWSCEAKPMSTTARIMNRTIQWGSGNPPRAVVTLPETGICLFFPDAIGDNDSAPEEAISAYLHGAPVQALQRVCGGRRAARVAR